MITVGVGSDIFMDELQQIATSPRKVFRSDFAGLSGLIGQLRDLICQGIVSKEYSKHWNSCLFHRKINGVISILSQSYKTSRFYCHTYL